MLVALLDNMSEELDLDNPPAYIDPRLGGEGSDKNKRARTFRKLRLESTRETWLPKLLAEPKQSYLKVLTGNNNSTFYYVGYEWDEDKREYTLSFEQPAVKNPNEFSWLAKQFVQDVHPYTVHLMHSVFTHQIKNMHERDWSALAEEESTDDLWENRSSMTQDFDSVIIQIMLTATPLLVEADIPETATSEGQGIKKAVYTLYKFDNEKLNELCLRASSRVWAMAEENVRGCLADRDLNNIPYDANAQFLSHALDFAHPINATNCFTGNNETLWYIPWVFADWVFLFPHHISKESYRVRKTRNPFRNIDLKSLKRKAKSQATAGGDE